GEVRPGRVEERALVRRDGQGVLPPAGAPRAVGGAVRVDLRGGHGGGGTHQGREEALPLLLDPAQPVGPEAVSRGEEVVGQRTLLEAFELRAETQPAQAIHGLTSRLGLRLTNNPGDACSRVGRGGFGSLGRSYASWHTSARTIPCPVRRITAQ